VSVMAGANQAVLSRDLRGYAGGCIMMPGVLTAVMLQMHHADYWFRMMHCTLPSA
jgi:hypothetical protein